MTGDNQLTAALLKAIVDSSDDAIISKDLDGVITSWNKGAERLFGYSAQAAIGQPISILIPEDRPDEERGILERVRRGERIEHFETVRVCKDRSRVAISLTISPIKDSNGKVVGLSKVARDITEQRKAQQASALLSAIVNSSDDAIISKDLNGVITSWNAGAERLFGYSAKSAIGQPISILIPDDRPNEETQILARVKHGERIDHFETVRVRKDRTKVDISLTISPIRDASGAIVGLSKVARDITERKHAKAALNTAKSLLARNEQLTLASKYKSQFLANMSHELRTPLNSLLILANLLQENREGTLTAKQVDYAKAIRSSGTDLLKLINEILDMSNIESGLVALDVGSLELEGLLNGLARDFRGIAAERGLEFRVALVPGLPKSIRTDAKRFRRVLENLLSNAFKFTERGSVSLTIGPAPNGGGYDHLALRSAESVIAVSVSDTGIGIPPGQRKIVFDAFQQGDMTSSRKYGGAGLGLTISRDIAKALGGEIHLKGGESGGSVFTLYVPAVYARFAPEPAPKKEKIDILMVDDQPANLFALESLLTGEDYALVQAASGPEALQCLLKQEFALILLDVRMPGMDGFQAAEEIRKLPRSRNTPIIFLTASTGSDEYSSKGYSLGAVDYLYKPIVPAVLKAKVSVFAELHRKTRELVRGEESLRLELAEHKKADIARNESDEKYHSLFSRATDAVVVFDADDETVLDANESALRLYGYSAANIRRLDLQGLYGLSAPEVGSKSAAPRQQRRTDGRTFPAELTCDRLSLNGKNLIIVMTRDVTERLKAAEAGLLRERETIQRKILSTVSHELCTPISVIKASAETLIRGKLAGATTRSRFLKIISSQSNHLTDLVKRLLLIAEIESGQCSPTTSEIALADFLKDFLPGISACAKRKGVAIAVDVGADFVLLADRSHLTGVFQNLLDNAIKYNKKNGSIGIRARRNADGDAEVTVSDTGAGISAVDAPLVFEQFYRSQSARDLSIKGSGLGLHIVKSLLASNGGRVWVESAGSGGSAFHFTLPRGAA